MKDKFKFLVEYGLEKKIKNKWFLIINIVLLVLSICLCNIDRIIKLFGGDFNKDTNILVIDNVGGFESFKMQFDDPKLVISTYDKGLDELSKEIEKDENKIGIVLNLPVHDLCAIFQSLEAEAVRVVSCRRDPDHHLIGVCLHGLFESVILAGFLKDVQLVGDRDIAVQGVLHLWVCRECFDVNRPCGQSGFIPEGVLNAMAKAVVANTHHVRHSIGGQRIDDKMK